MAIAHATLSDFRQSPRKMRLVANLVKGKKVSEALINLDFTAKRASDPVRTLIASALANAKSLGMDTENLIVKNIQVNSGKILYRRLPAARGSAHPMRKRTSQIYVELAEAVVKTKKTKITKEVAVAPKETKAPKAKKPASKKAVNK